MPHPRTFRNFVTIGPRLLRLIRVYAMVITGRTRRVVLPQSKNGLVVRGYKNSRNSEPPSGVEIFSAFWGSTHTSLFRDLSLPSIIQSEIFSSNFKIPINFVIYCPTEDWLEIESVVHKATSEAGAKYEWTHFDNTQDTSKNKDSAIKFLRDRVKIAENFDRVLVFAFPDHIFGRGLDRVIQSMKRGDYVVCVSARADMESSLESFKRLLDANRYSNQDLVRISADEFPHNIVKLAKLESHSYLRIKKQSDCFLVTFKEPPPLAIWGSSDRFDRSFERPMFGQIEVLDHNAPNSFFLASKLRLVADSNFFFWTELTSQDYYKQMINNRFFAESALYLNQCKVKWYY